VVFVHICIAVGDPIIKMGRLQIPLIYSTIAGSMNDNINMDSTMAGSMSDNINKSSTIAGVSQMPEK
jgi:hypothetical protein